MIINMKSRMKGDFHIRFCENAGVKFPRVTRLAAMRGRQCNGKMTKKIKNRIKQNNMSIPKYKTFTEKSSHFNTIKIDSIDDFREIYREHEKSQGIYRGINSSSYKIFTSKQREFLTKTTNKDYLSVLKSNKYIQEYFRIAKIPMTELSFYSLLQHYSKPTPLIDFTRNFSKTLFFALDGIDTNVGVEEIDNYFSVFFISASNLDLLDASEQFIGAVEHNKTANKYFESYEDYSESLILSHTEELVNIWIREVFLLENDSRYSGFIEIKNNHRIIMQEGVFVCNNYGYKDNSVVPLEEALKLFLKEEAKQNYYSHWDEMDINRPDVQQGIQEYENYIDKVKGFQKRLCENIITSYEVNKSLINEICSSFEIPSKELMYFDIEKILNNI